MKGYINRPPGIRVALYNGKKFVYIDKSYKLAFELMEKGIAHEGNYKAGAGQDCGDQEKVCPA